MGYDVQQALGDHEVTVESHGLTDKAGDGSNIVINFRFKFSDGELGNKDFYPCSSEKSLQITRKSLKAMGFDIDSRDIGELDANHELLKGQKVKAVVEEQEYHGKVSNKITWINALNKPVSDKLALKNLTMKLRAVKKENVDNEL
jgi:hypothetical protein